MSGVATVYTALNISRIEAMVTPHKFLAKAIREVLAHEYGHRICQTEDEGIADFVGDMILNRTGGCA